MNPIFCTCNKLCFKLFSISDYSLIIHGCVIGFPVSYLYWASLVAQTVKCLPAMQKTWVRSLGLEDPLEKEMASIIEIIPVFLSGKFHGWRSLVGYSPWGRRESDMTEQLQFLSFFSISIFYLLKT